MSLADPLRSRLRSAAAAALLGVCAPGACARDATPTAPDLRATVVEVVHADTGGSPVLRVYLARTAALPGAGALMPISLTDGSAVFVGAGGAERQTDPRALRAGQEIVVWFAGEANEADPATRRVRKVVIEGAP